MLTRRTFLKANILIDERGYPLLADFGLASITKNIVSVNASTPHRVGTIRWAAPKLLDVFSGNRNEWAIPTIMSDVYALAMVLLRLVFFTSSTQVLSSMIYC